MKDWKGNKASVLKTIGATGHANHERESFDYYATDPIAAMWLLKLEKLDDAPILEPSCGEGHLSKVMIDAGLNVTSRDLINRGFGQQADFLDTNNTSWNGHIVTNPPYRYAKEFVEKALSIIPNGNKVCMFLKLTFLESKQRKQLFLQTPPKRVWVSSSRITCAMNGDFKSISSSASAYAWYVWEKGYKGPTELKWFN